MKAQVLARYGTPEQAFELRELPDPMPKQGEAIIKVHASGLNFADVMARRGMYPPAPKPPGVIGYDVVGVVESVGDEKYAHLIGKRVAAFTRFGGYAEKVTTPVEAVLKIDDSVSNTLATAIGVQFSTAWYAACEQVYIHEGDRVLIHAAAGGVGLALVQLAKLRGAHVIGTASSQEKMALAKSYGADEMVSSADGSYYEQVRKIAGSIDISFNSLGGAAVKKDLKLLKKGGRLVCFGASSRKKGIINTLLFALRFGFVHPIGLIVASRGILGVNMLTIGDEKPALLQRCMQKAGELVEQGQLKTHEGGTFPASEIAEAHRQLENRSSMGKLIIEWE